ncbi:MAG: 4-hydroxythreonine-4-phosphate dehydrogenase PdxA [Planctomycetota bacterium]
MPRPRIAITMGDPAGVGPELCCRVAAEPALLDCCEPVVIGDPDILARVADRLALRPPRTTTAAVPDGCDPTTIHPGQPSAASGALALAAIEHAVRGCLDGAYAAMVTAPIAKTAIAASGCDFPGHTELLAQRCGGSDVAMMMYDELLAVVMSTCHRALDGTGAALCQTRIVRCALLLNAALTRLRARPPRLAMLGFNPHAGETGMFGAEEACTIQPAVDELRAAGITISDPLPPDTAFTPAARSRYDGHVCHYHDQALIPFKALCFDTGVNVTLGLPIIRTSVDHGTAFDIAWQGRAEPDSLRAALRLAIRLLPPQECDDSG